MGQSPDSINYTNNPNDHILVQGNADMKNGKVVPRIYTTQITKKSNKGDLIISVRAPVGDVGKTEYDIVLGRGVAGIKGNEFIYQTLIKMNCFGYWKRIIQGSTFESINSDDLKEAIIFLPTLPEQTLIGTFFRTLDTAITLHQRKLDGLRRLKKAYLQQMFPQDGERVPRVRFAGFSGEWVSRKLGEVFWERSERSADGELISVTINSGIIKSSSLDRKDKSSMDKSNYKKVEKGDIAYNSMRMWQGASGVSNYSGILSPAYTVIVPNVGTSSLFFAYMFKLTKIIQTFQASSQGLTSDTWNLKFPLLSDIVIVMPSFDEQVAIGNFFSNLDNQITAQSQKLKQLNQLKSAYLQKMFV
jgi:type I restriction enzyme S subunit